MKRKSFAWLVTFALALTTAALAQGGGAVGAAAGQPAPRSTRAVSGPPADQVVRQYLEAWAKKDFDTMYSLTTKEGQRQIAKEEFVQLLSQPERFKELLRLREETVDRSFGSVRTIAVYPPKIDGNIASVAFTVQLLPLGSEQLPPDQMPYVKHIERATAYAVVEDNQWRLPMYFNEQSKTWHLPPTAMWLEAGGMMPGGGAMGMPAMPGMGGVAGGGGGLGGDFGGAMGGGMGPPDSGIRTVIIPIRNVDVTSIAALFGVGGPPMMGGMMPGGMAMGMPGMGGLGGGMPGMPGMPGMGGMPGMPGLGGAGGMAGMPGTPGMPGMPGMSGSGGRGGAGGGTGSGKGGAGGSTGSGSGGRGGKGGAGGSSRSGDVGGGADAGLGGGAGAPMTGGGMSAHKPTPVPVPFAIGSLTPPPGIVNIVALIPRNALLVQGTEEGIVQLRVIIEELDAPIDQIALEVMLLETASEDLKELNSSNQTPNVLTPQQVRTALQRLGGKAKVLSKPQVTTLNGIPAEVSAITQIPETGRIVEGNCLSFTPRSNQDGTITLHTRIEVFRPSGQNTVSSTVTVPNGAAAVVSGLPKDGNKVLTVIVTPRIVGTSAQNVEIEVPSKMVDIQALYVEMDPSVLNTFGIDWSLSRSNASAKGGDIEVGNLKGDLTTPLASLLQKSKARIITAPRTTALNNLPALFATGGGAESVTLQVTPTVNQDKTVTLNMGITIIKNSKPQTVNALATVRDGGTIALRFSSKPDEAKPLLLFLTPKIVKREG